MIFEEKVFLSGNDKNIEDSSCFDMGHARALNRSFIQIIEAVSIRKYFHRFFSFVRGGNMILLSKTSICAFFAHHCAAIH